LADRTVMDFSRAVSFALPDIETAGTTQTSSGSTGSNSSALAFAGPGGNAALVAGESARIPALSAYADASALPFNAPTAVYGGGTAVWARGFAGERVQDADGALVHADNRFFGGLIGGGWQAQPNWRLGAFLGAGEMRSSLDFNYGGVKSTLVFGGLFARYDRGASFLKISLQGGHSHNDSTRTINNNLAPGGIETATASYDGWYIDPEATFGHRFALGSYAGGFYTLTPSLTVRYLHVAFDGYTESGTTAPLTVGSRSADDFEERGELKLSRAQAFASGAILTTDLFGGVIADERAGDETIDATLLGQAIPFATPGDDDVWGGLIGGGLEWRQGRTALYAQADYLAFSDQSSVVEGEAGLRVSF
jgi:outer membrane autotransporter protein